MRRHRSEHVAHVAEAADPQVLAAVARRMERFVGMAKLKRLALNVLSRELTGKELKALKDVFLSIDVDRSGKISTKELQAALQPHLGAENATAGDLLKAVDVSGDDEIDYNEFLAATMQRALYKQEENIRRVFQRLDVDGSGEITVANLVEITGSKKHAMELLNEADLNADQARMSGVFFLLSFPVPRRGAAAGHLLRRVQGPHGGQVGKRPAPPVQSQSAPHPPLKPRRAR